MPSRLADYLNAARRAHFVGRETERQFFREAIQADSPSFFVLSLYGPGGIGKSTLLREFGCMAEATRWLAVYFDTRNIEPLPEAFTDTLPAAWTASPKFFVAGNWGCNGYFST